MTTLVNGNMQCCKSGYKRDTQVNMRYHPGKSWWMQLNIQLEEKTQDSLESLQKKEVAKWTFASARLYSVVNYWYVLCISTFAIESTEIVLDTCTCCEEVDVDMNLYLISYCTGTIYCLVSDIVMTNLSVYTWCILSTCIGLSQVCNTCDYHGWWCNMT